MDSIGFIVLRHVNSAQTNKYWQLCYDCIRRFYPENKIVIIDDNSNKAYLTEKTLYKTEVVASEFPMRGELLPYLYFLKYRYFETAVILHDSTFINRFVDFRVDKYKILWTFKHIWDRVDEEAAMIKSFKNEELYDFFSNKWAWTGCFGAMAVVDLNFLTRVNQQFNFFTLVPQITKRTDRMCFERVVAVLFQFCDNKKNGKDDHVFYGEIHDYCPYGIVFQQREKFAHLPITKVWTGR